MTSKINKQFLWILAILGIFITLTISIPHSSSIENMVTTIIFAMIVLMVFTLLAVIAGAIFINSQKKNQRLNEEYQNNKERIFKRLIATSDQGKVNYIEGKDGICDDLSDSHDQINKTKVAHYSSLDTYFAEAISDNLVILREYYTLVKAQTSNSFVIALCACIAGFVLMAMPMAFDTFGNNATDISNLSTYSGIMAELVSALFFYIYSRTVTQLRQYHYSLINVQNILLSYKLINEIDDQSQKSRLITSMITSILVDKSK